MAGAKRGGKVGEGEKRERGEKERELTLFPQSLSLFPSRLLFSRRVKPEPKKVFAPRKLLDGEYRKRFAAIG